MSSSFYQVLKKFIWPRYREEGPPSYIDSVFFDKECIDREGKMREPAKSVLEAIVLGYRPVTTLSILSLLVENRNKPMYGTQLGKEMEKKFRLPKGWFTKTRYYDTRVGKLLKILCRLNIIEETEFTDPLTKRRYVGYRIVESNYPRMRERMRIFIQGGTLSIFRRTPSVPLPRRESERGRTIKRCVKCKALITSLHARYCELCGNPLALVCSRCKHESSLEYTYCLHCGEKLAE